tara:strand:+ start:187 stop:801 length:615 start_codon:yes stop_codon:yes gene_type:complete
MAQYDKYDAEKKRREAYHPSGWSNRRSSYLNKLYKSYGDQLRAGSPLHHIESYLTRLNDTFVDEAEAKGLYDKRLNDIQAAFNKMQTEQEQKWSTWNARWDEANKPQLLNVGGTEMPVGGVGDYIHQMNQYWGGEMQKQDRQLEQTQRNQLSLEDQLRNRQRKRTSDWAGPRQDWSMYSGAPRYSGGYGGGGYNEQLTIDNLNI